MNTQLELEKTLKTLRQNLAKKRAARKAQTNSDLRAFELVSEEVAAQSENPLLEQNFRADSVLAHLDALRLERHALHAWRLAFPHPGTGEPAAFEAPLPPDLQGFWDGCRAAPAP